MRESRKILCLSMLSLVLSPLACSFEPQLDLTRYEACDARGDCAVEACSCLEKWWICAHPKAAPEACRPEEPTCETDAACDDGIACTDDLCNMTTNECVNSPNDENCPDDTLFCNGSRICDADNGCIGTGNPCAATGLTCDEENNTCLPSAECGNGILDEEEDCDPEPSQNDICCDMDTCRWTAPGLPDPQGECSGALECQLNVCGGEGECTIANAVDHTPCMDDGLFCNGIEWCLAGVCEHAGNPCEVATECDEANNECTICGAGNFLYRKRITVRAGNVLVPKNYSVYFTEDTETLINEDKLRSDSRDWRIYYLRESMCTELDRWIDTDLGGGWDSTTSRTWFKTRAAIDASDSDGSYFVHYGNPADNLSTAPAHWSDSMGADSGFMPSAVFLAADDFEEQIEGQQPDGWTVHEGCSGIVVVNDGDNKVLSDGNGTGGNVTAGPPTWTDVAVRQKVKSIDGEIHHAGVVVRYFDETHEVYGGIVTNTTSEIWDRIIVDFDQIDVTWDIDDVGTSWQVEELRIAGDTVDFYLNDIFIGGGTIHAGVATQGASGFWCQYGQNAYRDNHIVRLYVDPEPTAGAGIEEPLP